MTDLRELFEEAHETLIEDYLAIYPGATRQEASEATSDQALANATDAYAARVDAISDAAKDEALYRTSVDAD